MVSKKTVLIRAIAILLSGAVCCGDEALLAASAAFSQHSADTGQYQMNEREFADQASAAFWLRRVDVSPSEILTETEIRSITAAYENREATLSDLETIVAKINQLYQSKQFITAKAILPPQKIENGVVKILLVEGRIGKITVTGNKHTRQSYILNRLSGKSGDLVHLGRLKAEMERFNFTNDVQLQADLKPGAAFGTTDIVLKVREPENSNLTLFTDSYGRDSVGEYRAGFVYTNNSLTGSRDAFTVTGLWTEGTLAGSVAYSLPVSRQGTRLGLSYDKNQSSVIAGGFESLDIRGDYSDIAVSLHHPFHSGFDYSLSGIAEYHRKKSGALFSGAELLNNDVTAMVLGMSCQRLREGTFLYFRQDATIGEARSDNSRRFTRFNTSLAMQRKLGRKHVLALRAAAQITGDSSLPSTERFSLGGSSTVRGYPEGELSGDYGFYINAEYYFRSSSPKTQSFVFADHGGAFPYRGAGGLNGQENYLTGAGIGFNMNFTKDQAGRIVLARPFSSPNGYNDNFRIHFLMQTALR